MSALPSYREATERQYWLDLAAPYVFHRDYWCLCLVNRQAWSIFAPRLWTNIFQSVRRAGLDPADDIEWWLDFVFDRLPNVRAGTRALARVLDAHGFAVASYNFGSYQHQRTLQQSFRLALDLCPNIDSIVLDDHEDIDPSFLIQTKTPEKGQEAGLRVLSLVGSSTTPLPATFFLEPALENLIYLDVSEVPGSILLLCKPSALCRLQILKLRAREADDASVEAISKHFRLQLWSLDLSSNKATDAAIDTIRSGCVPVTTLRSDAHFRTEGRVKDTGLGSHEHGPFLILEESALSGSFSHPERYLVDAPMYRAEQDAGPQPGHRAFRNDGREHIKDDSVDAVTRVITGRDDFFRQEDLARSRGLTHLRLSRTRISSSGVQKLLRTSNGHLESLEIACNPLLPPASPATHLWPKSAKLYGHIGIAHLLRPVFASNLRTLRVHHSLVTQIPSLEVDGMSTLARDFLSENVILNRVEKSFAQPFTPDMNPRLTSLTLTCIPRRSCGPLISRLIKFLRDLSLQEQSVRAAGALVSPSRGTGILKGLRHLRLEFEPDALEEGFSAAEDLDAEELMIGEKHQFSFFDGEQSGRPATEVKLEPAAAYDCIATTPTFENGPQSNSDGGPRIIQDSSQQEHITYHGQWNGKPFSVPVWAGPLDPSPSANLETYRKLVTKYHITSGVGPATPAQVQAGVPEGSFLFQDSWTAAIMPSNMQAPSRQALMQMEDVLKELKKYRIAERAKYTRSQRPTTEDGDVMVLGEPHPFWTGNLEVVTEETLPHSRPTKYWR